MQNLETLTARQMKAPLAVYLRDPHCKKKVCPRGDFGALTKLSHIDSTSSKYSFLWVNCAIKIFTPATCNLTNITSFKFVKKS